MYIEHPRGLKTGVVRIQIKDKKFSKSITIYDTTVADLYKLIYDTIKNVGGTNDKQKTA